MVFFRPLNFLGAEYSGNCRKGPHVRRRNVRLGVFLFFFAEFGPIFISSYRRGAISTAGAATWKMNKTFETLLYLK